MCQFFNIQTTKKMKRLTFLPIMFNLQYLAGFLSVLLISLTSCNDDANDLLPITLRDKEDPNITILYRGQELGLNYFLQGGDGIFSVQSGNDEVVSAKLILPNDLSLTIKGLGKTIVVVTDDSQNSLVLDVQVDYETHNWVVVRHDVTIYGDDLTENEKKAIQKKLLTQIPVKVGGGYKFIHSDVPNNKGKAIIYPENYGYDGIEIPFEYKEIENKIFPESSPWGYEIEMTIDNEKRFFVLGRYNPNPTTTLATRMSMPEEIALKENVTEKVQIEYPKAELVYSSQVVERKSY